MRIARRLSIAAGLVLLAAALGIVLWPLHANGVSGSALLPHYSRYFGFVTFRPIPTNPTTGDLRQAGVTIPQDVVAQRRHLAVLIAIIGLIPVVAAAGIRALDRRRRPST